VGITRSFFVGRENGFEGPARIAFGAVDGEDFEAHGKVDRFGVGETRDDGFGGGAAAGRAELEFAGTAIGAGVAAAVGEFVDGHAREQRGAHDVAADAGEEFERASGEDVFAEFFVGDEIGADLLAEKAPGENLGDGQVPVVPGFGDEEVAVAIAAENFGFELRGFARAVEAGRNDGETADLTHGPDAFEPFAARAVENARAIVVRKGGSPRGDVRKRLDHGRREPEAAGVGEFVADLFDGQVTRARIARVAELGTLTQPRGFPTGDADDECGQQHSGDKPAAARREVEAEPKADGEDERGREGEVGDLVVGEKQRGAGEGGERGGEDEEDFLETSRALRCARRR